MLKEKGFQFSPNPLGIFQTIHSAVARRGWADFYQHPRDLVLPVVKEFFANMLRHDQCNIWVKNSPLDTRVINVYYNLPANIECEYFKLVANLNNKLWNQIFKTLTVEERTWANEEGWVVNRVYLTPIARVWVEFLKSCLMPTTQTTTVSQE